MQRIWFVDQVYLSSLVQAAARARNSAHSEYACTNRCGTGQKNAGNS